MPDIHVFCSYISGYGRAWLKYGQLVIQLSCLSQSCLAKKHLFLPISGLELTLFQACDLVKRGGLLILSSPYTWKEEHTEVDKWIGGNYKDAEKCFTERGLEAIVRGRGLVLREDAFSGAKPAR